MKELNLGLTQEKILIGYFQLQEPNNIEKYNVLKLDLLKNPAIDAVSWSHNAPFFRQEWWDINIEGEPTNKKYHLQHNHIDSNFIKTYGIKILIGHSLSSKLATDTIKYCLINDNASHLFGWGDSAVGKIIYNNSDPYEVVGIMNDFYINSISRPVEPCFFSYSDRDLSWPNTHSIRIKRGYDVNTMNKWVTKKFRAYFPNSNLEFTDYDEIKSRVNFSFIDILYNLVSGFSIIALIIASLGLYGLVSFISRKRTKEIGVRKVNGAYTFDIYKLMVKEFIIMLLIAYVLALPLIYFISNKIIVNFANHTKVGIGIYVFALIVSLAITLITISIEIIKASHTNPVDSLRYE
jgi:putative ABC transport system permease protein